MHEAAENVYDAFEFLDILAPPRNWHGKFSFEYGYAFLEREVSFQNDSDSCKLTFEGRKFFCMRYEEYMAKKYKEYGEKNLPNISTAEIFLAKNWFLCYKSARFIGRRKRFFSTVTRRFIVLRNDSYRLRPWKIKKIRRLSSADFLLRKIF